MNIKFLATRIELTPELKGHIEKKLSSVEKLIDPTDETVLYEVEIGKTTERHENGDVYKAEVHVRKKGGNIYATAHAEDVLSAMDIVKDEVRHALSSDKEKKETLLRKGQMQIKKLMKRLSW